MLMCHWNPVETECVCVCVNLTNLGNDSIRAEMRILLNGVAVPSIAFTGMQCWTYSEGWNT